MLRAVLCLVGIHRYGEPDWQMAGLDAWFWFRRCARCGRRKTLKGYTELPRSRFWQRADGVYIEERC